LICAYSIFTAMKNKQEFWTMMIVSGYAAKIGKTISESLDLLLKNGGIKYIDECYNVLHLLSNDDVIDELLDISNRGEK